MSAAIIQGLGRPRSMPCFTTATPERHSSTSSSRLTTGPQPSRRSSSWTTTDSNISTSPSASQIVNHSMIPAIEGHLEHELSWYRNIEDWDFDNKMVKIGPPLWRQREKHDSIQAEAAEETRRAEAEEEKKASQAAQEKDESMKAILTHLQEQAGCTSETEGLPKRVIEPMSVPMLKVKIRGLREILARHRKHGGTVMAIELSEELDYVQCLILFVDNYSAANKENEDGAGLSSLRSTIHELISDFESLINPHRTCVVCGRRDKANTYPSKLTSNCAHETNTCAPCLRMWVESQITTKGLNIKCVECPELFAYEDIQICATPKMFEKYDRLSARATMTAIEDFRWCLNPSCAGGQEHLGGARFQCHSCHHRFCVKHGTAWHQNETCQQYDTRWIAARIQDQASEEWKAVQVRKCPKCGALIEKDGGCDHMNCTAPGCSHIFSWSGAQHYEAQDPVPPPMSTKASVATPASARGERRFKISRIFRLFSRTREEHDIC